MTKFLMDMYLRTMRPRNDGNRGQRSSPEIADRKPIVVAVTGLPSLDTKALFEMGWEMPLDEQVQRLVLLG